MQRREEIRAIAKEFRRLFLHEQAQAIDELLAHIDALEQAAAERVIADGSRGLMAVPEILLHDLALAAWDEGADAGMAWDPDADPAKRGVVPCTPEEGIAKARDHFAKHGSGSPSSAFSRALQAIREHSRAIPADRVPGDGNQFGVGFVEACGMLAAKPFDRPTLAAGLIREGGMVSALAETSSDGPGISVLRVEMRTDLDALRANQEGAAT